MVCGVTDIMIINWENLIAISLCLCSFWIVLYLATAVMCEPENETKLAINIVKIIISVLIIIIWICLWGSPIS